MDYANNTCNMAKANAQTTATHLLEYIPQQLADNGLDAKYVAYMMERTFGKEVHTNIDGFINFAKDDANGLTTDDIVGTLCHDVSGGVNRDTMMLPRVSDYGQFSK